MIKQNHMHCALWLAGLPLLFALLLTACGDGTEPSRPVFADSITTPNFEEEVAPSEQPEIIDHAGQSLAYDEALYAVIEVKEGYQVEEFGESEGETYRFSVFCLRSLTDENDLYWEIVVNQGQALIDILRVESDEHGMAFPACEDLVSELDVNFDGAGDILICLGHFGTQGALRYQCYLALGDELVHCPSFTEIPNPSVDAEAHQILSTWRNWAASHSWGKYSVENNTFVLTQRLTEEPVDTDSVDEMIWSWTDEVREDGEWVVRDYFTSADMTEDELQEKLNGASSRWGIWQANRWFVLNPQAASASTKNEPALRDRYDMNFSDLENLTFWFGSGTGAWSTVVEIQPDGTFNGYYHDSDLGVNSPDYPNGTRYECNFSGVFTPLSKIGDHEYTLRCESLTLEQAEGLEEIRDDTRIIYTGPYGFDNADEFRLYLPGKRVGELPEMYREWVGVRPDYHEMLPFYGLYNIGGEQGFRSYSKDQP